MASLLELDARDFGALGAGDTDDGPALRAAIAAAVERGLQGLRIRPGTYRCGPGDAGFCLALDQAPGLALEAEGATLLVTQPLAGGVRVTASPGAAVRGLRIDYDPLPVSTGTISAINRGEGWFEFTADPASPSLAGPQFELGTALPHPQQFGVVLAAPGELKPATADHVFAGAWEHLDPRRSRVSPLPAALEFLAQVEPGDRFVYLARGGGCAVEVRHSDDVLLGGITVNAASGHSFLVHESAGVRVRDCAVRLVDGRMVTSNGDGVHAPGCRVGPRVTGCHFEGMMDDGLNVYASPLQVLEVSGAVLRLRGSARVEAGDRLEFFSAVAGLQRGTAVVVDVQPVPGGATVRLDAAPGGLAPGPDHLSGDIACNLDACSGGFEVAGNVFRRHRGLGMRIRATDGRVSDNLVERLSSFGILVANDPDWPEGPLPARIEIARNTVRDCGTSNGANAVRVIGAMVGARPSPHRLVREITLQDNNLQSTVAEPVYVGSATGVRLLGNQLHAAHPEVRALTKIENADVEIA